MRSGSHRAKHLRKTPASVRPRTIRQVRTIPTGPRTRRRMLPRVQFWSTCWAMLPVLSFGLATPIVIGHAASRLKSTILGCAAVGYAVALVTSLALSSGTTGSISDRIGVGLFSAVMLVGAAHAFALRTLVFELDTFDVDRYGRARALRLVRRSPVEAALLGIGRIDHPSRAHFRDGGLIDVNNVGAGTLEQVLGLDAAMSEEIVNQRVSVGGFVSTADLEVQLNLEPHVLDHIRTRLIYLPIGPSPLLGSPGHVSNSPLAVCDGRRPGVWSRRSTTSRQVISWIWGMAPLLSGSILAAPATAFAAARLRSRGLWLLCIVFLVATVACFIIFDGASSDAWTSNAAALIIGGAGSALAVGIRKKVFELDPLGAGGRQRKEALRIIALDPVEALRLHIGQVDVNERDRFPDGGLIDMNNASASAIQEHVFFDEGTAQRLVEVRDTIGGYESLSDLCGTLDVPPQRFDAVVGRLVFLPLKGGAPHAGSLCNSQSSRP